MRIEERILNDSGCSAYVDTNRKYVEIAFKDGAYWGYEQGCKDMIDKAWDWFYNMALDYMSGDITDVKWGSMKEDFFKAMEE